MKTFFLALRTIAYIAGFLLFWVWMASLLSGIDRRLRWRLPVQAQALGLVIAVAGAALALACAVVFVISGRGTPAPFDAPRQFVAQGPYRYVRNPMYVGGLACLAGLALYLHSAALLVLAVIAFLAVHLFILFYEEPTLRRRFGAPYQQYCRDVRRWVPRLPKESRIRWLIP